MLETHKRALAEIKLPGNELPKLQKNGTNKKRS